ncbi:hypothetical protein P5E59_14865 [Clostridium perfringens]|uniref:hypothetical protein n=2 Tax=Clostridium perfringens TaxID=1502 RepID=UPI002975C224|nr:hypothetical protein [Clostridium perfringens]MDK0817912.1 hypothetical protein [Clostridium perfringens]MDM0987571.1 hypothetical protein [Clostridium perfringens]MDZ5019656.1 hypothetical protein [Clostridium perfringens]
MRTFHPSKIRDIVQYTGRIYSDDYVRDNKLEDDFCYTINDVANMLDLAIGTVQTFIVPRLDVAVAGEYIREYMKRPQLKRAISKSSLTDFIGWYVDEVSYDCDTYAISRIDPDTDFEEDEVSLEHKLIFEIHEILGNAKRIQPFLNFSSNYLEQQHFVDYEFSQEEQQIRTNEAVKSILDNNILSFSQLKKELKKRHNQQVYRWLDKNAHTKLILKSLDTSGAQKRDNVRYILKPNINVLDGNIVETVDLTHGKPYFLNVFEKTKASLQNLESDESLYVLVLYTILENVNAILPKFEKWEAEQKAKKEKKKEEN